MWALRRASDTGDIAATLGGELARSLAGPGQRDRAFRAFLADLVSGGRPRLVIFEDGGKKAFVEVPGEKPKDSPRKIEIVTGLSDGLNIEVVSGLKKGDRVIERPPKEIKGM